MYGRFRTLAVLCSLGVLAGCTKKDDAHTASAPPPPVVTISASPTSLVANGTNTANVLVTNTGGGSVTLTISPAGRGSFPGNSSTATISGASASVTLTACNSATPGCTGTATLTATGSSGTATTNVTFVSLVTACQTNCAADSACATLACNLSGGGTGACSSTVPHTCVTGSACTPTPPTATSEVSCSDGIDNDCNGMKDCADSACDGQPCLVGQPTYACKAGTCTDVSTGMAVTVTPLRSRLPANGTATTTVVVEVTSGSDPVAASTVSLSSTLGSVAPAAAMTGADGKARFTFTASAASGTATVTAQLQPPFASAKGTALITMPKLGALELVTDAPGSIEFPVMGAIGSGWQEFGWIQVKAVDDLGLPYPDGLDVRFQHQTLGGSTLRGPLTADVPGACAAPSCVGFLASVFSGTDAPDTTGLASAWIYSGRVAGTLPVTASATAGGISRTVLLPTIAVVGAKASGANFSLVCSPRNLPALAETDCAVSLVDAPFTCEAFLKDRFGNVLGRSTQVMFGAEAGAVGQITWTDDYDSTKTGDGQMGLGIAVQGFNTLGAGLPFDVDPITTAGEPSVVHNLDGCGLRTHNPRDGVVTIIAIADGEEAYFDANGNGSYDLGEPFVDQGEPYIDQNDNGQWDPGEWFLDLDGNGTWTPPNGVWDANTKIWTQTFVVYTGTAATLNAGGGRLLGTRVADAGTFVNACTSTLPATPFDVQYDSTIHPGTTTQTYDVVASDMNMNFLNMNSKYSIDQLPSDADFKLFYGGLASYTDLVGMDWRYWACQNGGAGPCASQCRSGVCQMRAEFTGFDCGLTSWLSVTGGSKLSTSTVRWLIDVPWQRYGTGAIERGGASVSGKSH